MGNNDVDKINDNDTCDEDSDQTKLYCICRKPDDGSAMIQCPKCSEWFHIRCIKITESQRKRLKYADQFNRCPLCNKKNEKQKEPDDEDEKVNNKHNKRNNKKKQKKKKKKSNKKKDENDIAN